MPFRSIRALDLTAGERCLVSAFVAVMALGGIVTAAVLDRVAEGAVALPSGIPSAYGIWILCAGAIGSGLAFWLGLNRFGQRGALGLAQVVPGILAHAFIAALIGGTLALPAYGTMFGPFLLAVTLGAAPVLLAGWVVTLVAAHLLLSLWRRERDSIFDARLPAERPASFA